MKRGLESLDDKIDFLLLRNKYPSLLEQYVNVNNKIIDFTDANAMIALTKAYLLELGISIELPANRLCPPVPGRLAYIDWIHTLIQPTTDDVHILDIGVGTSCIYPLLGHAKYGWKFIGSDIDPMAVQWATKNVDLNLKYLKDIDIIKADASSDFQKALSAILPKRVGTVIKANSHTNNIADYNLTDRRKKIRVDENNIDDNIGINDMNTDRNDLFLFLKKNYNNNSNCLFRGPLRQALLASDLKYSDIVKEEERNAFSDTIESNRMNGKTDILLTACMTNPPFYDINDHIIAYDNTICTASTVEKVTEGGEEAFLAAIIADSLVLRNRICWFTCMTGKKSTINILRQLLSSSSSSSSSNSISKPTIVTSKFMPGKTVRYGFAWSWIHTNSKHNNFISNCDKILLTVNDFTTTITKDELLSSPSLPSVKLSPSELLHLVMLRIKKSCTRHNNKNDINFIVELPSTLSMMTTASMSGTAVSGNRNLFEFVINIIIDNDIEIDVIPTINNNTNGEISNVKNCVIGFSTNLKNDIIRKNRWWRRVLAE